MQTSYLVFALILMLPGLAGIIIPIFPGIPYMFIVALLYGTITHFHTLSYTHLTILGIVALLSFIVDYSTGLVGAKYGGAARRSIIFGLLGSIIGTIALPPFGGIAGLFLAILFSELFLHNDNKKAIRAASSSLLGSLAGIIINLFLALIFIICFIVFAL